MTDWKAKLKALDPCPEAYRWAIKHKTLREAWRMCERGDWMRWLEATCSPREDYDMADALSTAIHWGVIAVGSNNDLLCDAYIVLDFMPNPPRLPEIE